MAKKLVDVSADGGSGTKNELRYTDAVTGKGVGISKTDYSSPRSGAPSYAEIWQEQNRIKEENAKDKLREAVTAAAAAGKAGSTYGILSGYMGLGSEQQKQTETPQTPETSGGGNGGGGGGSRVTYIDAAGNGGGGGGSRVTYIDAAGNAQKGTTAPSETPSQTTEPQKSYLDDLKDQYQKMYDDAVKANNDAAKAAAERALAQVEQSIGELGDQYGSLNKQLYRDYMESLRVLPQEMAARGYSGGMSESARLGLDTAYGERLNENEAARIAAIMQLRQQGADAEYQANAARDQANAQAQQNLYANMMNLILQQQQDAATKAQNMAQYGDFSGYLELGYTRSEIDQMQKAWIAANPELAKALGYVKTPEPVYSSYGGGGGGGSGSGTTPTIRETVQAGIEAGTDRRDIWNALAADYKAGNITQEEFNDGIHYADYLETAKSFGQTASDAGYAKWRGGK